MKVHELRSFLSNLPDDLELVVPGYESGYEPLGALEAIRVSLMPLNPWYEGLYQRADEEDDDPGTEVLFLKPRPRKGETPA